MNRYQPFSFRHIDDFLSHLPQEEYVIVTYLRRLVLQCIPDVKEKLAYNVPFYYRHSRICFIWPGAIPWGKQPKTGVEFGFCKGHLLSDPSYLNAGNRKEVYIKTFYDIKEVDSEILRSLLYEAVSIDETAMRVKK
jgi:hypothetical protein